MKNHTPLQKQLLFSAFDAGALAVLNVVWALGAIAMGDGLSSLILIAFSCLNIYNASARYNLYKDDQEAKAARTKPSDLKPD